MSESRFDLLRDPLLSIDVGGEQLRVDLPTVFETLGRSDRVEFTSIQAHQQEAWHAFLVQLAAVALNRADATQPIQETPTWRNWLRELADGEDAAWQLVVDDLSRPAFMQPPVPEGALDRFKAPVTSPSLIDVLVTSKNHDVKMHRIVHAHPEHWIYALVTLQTMQGFLGAGNYGIARMNGGFGSRASVAFAPGLDLAARFRRDVRALIDARSMLVDSHGFAPVGGAELLWLVPWDGADSLRLADCDPYFVEVCRRLRLVLRAGQITSRAKSSQAARVSAKEALGDVGDPWLPVNRATGKALTVSAAGLNYRRLRDLLFGADWTHGAAGAMRAEDGPTPVFRASVMVRGQGETGGLLERTLRIPRPVKATLRKPNGRDRIDAISRQALEAVSAVQRKVLYPALRELLEGVPDAEDLARKWVRRHDESVDRIFFDHLWRLVAEEADDTSMWESTLVDLAHSTLDEAIRATPFPGMRRLRSIATAERVLRAAARKHLGQIESQHTEDVE